MAGRSNIIWWLESNGYEVEDELVDRLFEVAKNQRRLMEHLKSCCCHRFIFMEEASPECSFISSLMDCHSASAFPLTILLPN